MQPYIHTKLKLTNKTMKQTSDKARVAYAIYYAANGTKVKRIDFQKPETTAAAKSAPKRKATKKAAAETVNA
jgi:hypothetical protein